MIRIPHKLLTAAVSLATEAVSVQTAGRTLTLTVTEAWGYCQLRQVTTWDSPDAAFGVAVSDAKLLLAIGGDAGGVRVDTTATPHAARSLDSANPTVVEFAPWGHTPAELVDAVLDSTSDAVTVEPKATARLLRVLAALSEDEAPLYAMQAGKSGLLINDTVSTGLTVNACVAAPASLFGGGPC